MQAFLKNIFKKILMGSGKAAGIFFLYGHIILYRILNERGRGA